MANKRPLWSFRPTLNGHWPPETGDYLKLLQRNGLIKSLRTVKSFNLIMKMCVRYAPACQKGVSHVRVRYNAYVLCSTLPFTAKYTIVISILMFLTFDSEIYSQYRQHNFWNYKLFIGDTAAPTSEVYLHEQLAENSRKDTRMHSVKGPPAASGQKSNHLQFDSALSLILR